MSMAVPNTKSIATFVGSATIMPGTRIGKALGLKSMETHRSCRPPNRPELERRTQVPRYHRVLSAGPRQISQHPRANLRPPREAGTFDRRESEQLLRLAEISQSALELFDGDTTATRTWLTSPVRGSATHARLTSPKASSVLAKCAI